MNDQIGIYDHLTGELTTREMTDQEQADRNAEIEAAQAAKDQAIIDAETKAESKLALLEKLGITEDEAKLLLS